MKRTTLTLFLIGFAFIINTKAQNTDKFQWKSDYIFQITGEMYINNKATISFNAEEIVFIQETTIDKNADYYANKNRKVNDTTIKKLFEIVEKNFLNNEKSQGYLIVKNKSTRKYSLVPFKIISSEEIKIGSREGLELFEGNPQNTIEDARKTWEKIQDETAQLLKSLNVNGNLETMDEYTPLATFRSKQTYEQYTQYSEPKTAQAYIAFIDNLIQKAKQTKFSTKEKGMMTVGFTLQSFIEQCAIEQKINPYKISFFLSGFIFKALENDPNKDQLNEKLNEFQSYIFKK